MERLRRAYDIQIVYRHFPLHPETPREGRTLKELFAGRNIDIRAAQTRMVALMNEEGLPYGERTMTYNSRLAQELASWAETQPNAGGIHDALFRAYFVDNINLADVDHLIAIASKIGLPSDEASVVLRSRRFRDAVDTDWQRSRDLGVTGVPTFVVGDQGLVGAQSYEQIEKLVVDSGKF